MFDKCLRLKYIFLNSTLVDVLNRQFVLVCKLAVS
jgi:hypothetical protein